MSESRLEDVLRVLTFKNLLSQFGKERDVSSVHRTNKFQAKDKFQGKRAAGAKFLGFLFFKDIFLSFVVPSAPTRQPMQLCTLRVLCSAGTAVAHWCEIFGADWDDLASPGNM